MATALLLIVTLIFQRNLEKHHPKEKNTKEEKICMCEMLLIVDLQWQKQNKQTGNNLNVQYKRNEWINENTSP